MKPIIILALLCAVATGISAQSALPHIPSSRLQLRQAVLTFEDITVAPSSLTLEPTELITSGSYMLVGGVILTIIGGALINSHPGTSYPHWAIVGGTGLAVMGARRIYNGSQERKRLAAKENS